MKQKLGTKAFTGLNVGTAPHLIEDHELTESYGGWTDQEGTWRTAKGPDQKYFGYSNITSFAAGRLDGEDHFVYTDLGDNYVYDNGSKISFLSQGSKVRMLAMDDGFLLFGEFPTTSKNHLYDGTVIRELGAYQGSDSVYAPDAKITDASSFTISGATKADPCVVTSDAHGITIGATAPVWIDNVVGMTELNGELWQGTSLTTTTMSLTCDSSNFTTYGSAGDVYVNACGLTGDYKYYMVTTLELSDESVLLGAPIGFVEHRQADPEYEGDTFTLTPTDSLSMLFGAQWSSGGTDHYTTSGAIGTDYYPGIRLYRTKDDGTDFYLEDSWKYGTDATLPSTFLWANSAVRFYSGTKDQDLGATYIPTATDNSNFARASFAAVSGQRLFLVPDNSLNEIHWSGLDRIEYFNPLSFLRLPDKITAIKEFRNRVVIWSADRMWLLDLTGGVPDLIEIPTPVGTTYDRAMATIDAGVLFLREDGLWLFNGVQVKCISRKAFDTIDEPKSVCAAADTIYLSGEDEAYVVRVRDGGWTWHQADERYDLADDTSGKIYAASQYDVVELFGGDYSGGYMVTKLFSLDSWESATFRIVLDVEGTTAFKVTVFGDRWSDDIPHTEDLSSTNTGRRLVRISIPRLVNHHFKVMVKSTGDLKVYGMWPEVTR